MKRAWEWSLAWRFLRSGNVLYKSFSFFCFLGLMVVVIGFVLTHTALSAFDTAYLKALVSFNGSGVFFKEDGLSDDDPLFAEIATMNAAGAEIIAVPFYYGETMLISGGGTGDQIRGVQIKAVRAEDLPFSLALYHATTRDAMAKSIYLGRRLYRDLGEPSKVQLLHSGALQQAADAQLPANQFSSFPVAGYFATGLSEFDETFILMPSEVFLRFSGAELRYHGVELFDRRGGVISSENLESLRSRFDYPYTFLDWKDLNQVFFQALKTEKTVFLLIAGAVMGIAVLNLMILTAIQMVQRTREWRVFEALGLSLSRRRRLFSKQMLILVSAGMVLGWIMAAIIVGAASRWMTIPLPAEIYFLETLPISLSILPFVVSGMVIFVSSVLAIVMAVRLGEVLQGHYRLH